MEFIDDYTEDDDDFQDYDNLIDFESAKKGAKGSNYQMPSPVSEGGRNHELTRYGGFLRGYMGASATDVRDMLQFANKRNCVPPLEEDEVDRIAKSVSRYPRNYHPAYLKEMRNMGVSEEGIESFVQGIEKETNGRSKGGDSQEWQLVSATELKQRPKPEFLVDGILPEHGLVVMFGEPESYKTFQALHMAYCVSSGKSYLGRDVKQGAAIYIAAEGSEYLSERLEGLELHLNEPGEVAKADLFFLEEASQMRNPEHVSKVIRLARNIDRRVRLIVIDTLSETAVGLKENQQEDMSRYFGAAKRLRDETGATVLILHHKNRGSKEIRGSSVIMGTVDTAIDVSKVDGVEYRVKLSAAKQRGFERFKPIFLRGFQVPLGDSKRPTLVFTMDDSQDEEAASMENRLPKQKKAALEAIRKLGEATYSEWLTASRLAPRTFNDARTHLVGKGLVEQRDEKYVAKEVSAASAV